MSNDVVEYELDNYFFYDIFSIIETPYLVLDKLNTKKIRSIILESDLFCIIIYFTY